MKHILTLSPDYVRDWDLWAAVRELLQNALDQCESTGTTPEITWENKLLTIRTPIGELPPSTLLLGNTTKIDGPRQRGEFGEGYKLAMLVLARNLLDVSIFTGGEQWIPSIIHSTEFDSDVLQVERRPATMPGNRSGVAVIINGIDEPTWQLIQSRYLPGVRDTAILKSHPKQIFLGGLWVCECPGYRYGYNFAPGSLKVGRDRNIVRGFDLDWATSAAWASAPLDLHAYYDMLKASAPDVQHTSLVPAQTAKIIAAKYEKDYGEGCSPVTTQQQLDKARGNGLRAALVSSPLCSIVTSVKQFVFYDQSTPGYKMEQFARKFKDKMDVDAYDELMMLVEASKSWRC